MKNFLLLLSETLLEGLIHPAHMRTWRHLVAGVKAVVSSHVVLAGALAGAHQHFVDFYKGFARIHGTAACTPNIHGLLHLVPLVRLYGPCDAFWCFAFERYNKVLTEVHNNRTSIEISIMKQFIRHQQLYAYACTSLRPLTEAQAALVRQLGGQTERDANTSLINDKLAIETWEAYARRHNDCIGDEWLPLVVHTREHLAPTFMTEDARALITERCNSLLLPPNGLYHENYPGITEIQVDAYKHPAKKMTLFGETIAVGQRSGHVLVANDRNRCGYSCAQVIEIFTFKIYLISDLSDRVNDAKRRKVAAVQPTDILLAEAAVQSLQEAQSVEKLLTFMRVKLFREAGDVNTDDNVRVPTFYSNEFLDEDVHNYLPVHMAVDRFAPYHYESTGHQQLFQVCVLPFRINA
jgi:hypothetical protein